MLKIMILKLIRCTVTLQRRNLFTNTQWVNLCRNW